MIVVNRKNDRLTGAVEGKPFNILFTEEKLGDLKTVAARLEQSESKEVYNSIVAEAEKLVEVNFNEEVATANGYLMFNINKGTYHLVSNKGEKDQIVSEVALPSVLAARIVESYEEGSDFMPLIMAWRRFIDRSVVKDEDADLFANYLTAMYVDQEAYEQYVEEGMTEEAAIELATYNDISVTTYGLLATYKVVDRVNKIWKLVTDENGVESKQQVDAIPSSKTIDPVTGEVTVTEGKVKFLEELTFTPAICNNGDNFYCDEELGYKYQIGKEAVLPENAQRNYQNTFGGGGLYAGGLNYIQGYSSEGNETLTCFIDPSEIISFQSDGRAFRTNRMFINGAMNMEGETEGMYFVSDYAIESDARIKERFEEAIVSNNDAIAKAAKKAVDVEVNVKEILK